MGLPGFNFFYVVSFGDCGFLSLCMSVVLVVVMEKDLLSLVLFLFWVRSDQRKGSFLKFMREVSWREERRLETFSDLTSEEKRTCCPKKLSTLLFGSMSGRCADVSPRRDVYGARGQVSTWCYPPTVWCWRTFRKNYFSPILHYPLLRRLFGQKVRKDVVFL